jgi:hypothetical protein
MSEKEPLRWIVTNGVSSVHVDTFVSDPAEFEVMRFYVGRPPCATPADFRTREAARAIARLLNAEWDYRPRLRAEAQGAMRPAPRLALDDEIPF